MTLSAVERIIREVPQDLHENGSLSPHVLEALVELHRDAGVRVSAETGCGLTTLILSQMSEHHTSFTIAASDSLEKTQNHPLFRRDTTHFVIGPSQAMLPRWQFNRPLDLAIIDGPHAYPFPDMEYYFFYPQIRAGGILVVDDIHIPMIAHMYRFLRDDAMWEHDRDVGTTAFFRRTVAPLLNPFGDDWPLQRHQRRYFPYPEALTSALGAEWRERDFGSASPEQMTPDGYIAETTARADAERILARERAATGRMYETEAILAAVREELNMRSADLIQTREESERLRNDSIRLQEDLATRQESSVRLEAENAALRTEAKELREHLTAMRCSTSWRLTRPLRALRQRLST